MMKEVVSEKRVVLAAPRGYCAGVDRAVITVEKALERYGAPVYVRKQIVHNRHVVENLETARRDLRRRVGGGAGGLDGGLLRPRRLPGGARRGQDRSLKTIDATCPLVTKVHAEAKRFAREGLEIMLIGHAGHEEVEGTTGEAPENITLVQSPAEVEAVAAKDPTKVAWLSQTTLSVDETLETVDRLREKFPLLINPPSDDICYATQNRQLAVKQIAAHSDLVDRGRFGQLLQLRTAGRSGAGGRRPGGVPGGQRGRDRRRLAGRRDVGGGHERRLGAGRSGGW